MMLHLSSLSSDVHRGAPGFEGRQSGLAAGEISRIISSGLPRCLSLRCSLHAPRLPGQLCGDHQRRPVPLRPRGHAQWDVSISGSEQGGRFMAVSILRLDAPQRLRLHCTNETSYLLPSHLLTGASEQAIGENPILLLFFFFFLSWGCCFFIWPMVSLMLEQNKRYYRERLIKMVTVNSLGLIPVYQTHASCFSCF